MPLVAKAMLLFLVAVGLPAAAATYTGLHAMRQELRALVPPGGASAPAATGAPGDAATPPGTDTAAVIAAAERRIALWLVVVLGLSLVATGAVFQILVAPLARLALATRPVAGNRLLMPLPTAGRDEVGELTVAFAAMRADLVRQLEEKEAALDKLRRAHEQLRAAQEHVVHQERLRALGQMASGVAHDFNNALGPVIGFSDLLLTRPEELADTERARHYLRLIHTAASDAAGVVSRLREFYRHRERPDRFAPVDLAELASQTVSLTQPRWRHQALAAGATIAVVTDFGPLPEVAANEAELREALTNLIFNATDAMPGGGTITIRTRREGDEAVLEVADTGVGMTEAVRRRCLEPFFSTKGERGTGLGLAMVHGIVRRHGGALEIASTPGRGTCVTLRLPLARAATAARPKAPEPPRAAPRPLRVLVAEDEAAIREFIAACLRADGHACDCVANGRDALEKFRAGHYDVVLTDRAMPELGGDRVAAVVKQLSPETPVVMVTGFGDVIDADGAPPDGVDLVVGKPVTLEILRGALAAAIGRTS